MLYEFLICFVIIFSIFISFSSIGVTFIKIISSNENYLISYFIGKCFFILVITFFYEIFKTEIIYPVIIFFFISFICFANIINKNLNSFKKLLKIFFKFYFPIVIFLFLLAYIYGLSFYVFRGNQWDWFSQISLGQIFKNNSFEDLIELILYEKQNLKTQNSLNVGESYTKSYYFFAVGDVNFFQRKLQGLFMSSIFLIDKVNIFLLAYTLKTLFFASIFSAYYYFITCFDNKFSKFNIYLLSFSLTLSTWSFYLFEIDALAQLSTFSLVIIFFSIILEIYLKEINLFEKQILLFLISAGIFISYPEQALTIFAVSVLFFIIYKRTIFTEKKIYFLCLIFLIVISPKIIDYLLLSISMSSAVNDWWGYFGSYLLGRENLVFDENAVIQIKKIINDSKINPLEKFSQIFSLHITSGYKLVALTILPSIVGLYFLSDSAYSISNLFFLIILNLFLILIIFYNLKYIFFSNDKKIKYLKFYLIMSFVLCLYFLLSNKIYISLKIFYYFSPFIIIFLTIIFGIKNKLNYLIIFLYLIFPIYKFSDYNYGISRSDSFPSILSPKLKKDINWNIDLENILKCDVVEIKVNQQIPNIFISLLLDHKKIKYFNNTEFVSNNKNTIKNIDCLIYIKNNKIILDKI